MMPTGDPEKCLRVLGPMVQDVVEALVSMVDDLFPEEEGKESSLQEMIACAPQVPEHLLPYQQPLAFEGAREVLAMMKAHYPLMDVVPVIRFWAAVDPASLYPSLVEDAKFVAGRCDLTRILPESQPPPQ